MADEERVRLLIAKLVERAVDIISTSAELTPEMVIRGFPRTMSERADVAPTIDLVLDANEFFWGHHVTPTVGHIKARTLVRTVKVKLKPSEFSGYCAITSVVEGLNTPDRVC
ncbi:hypothetical protein [Halorubrum sp. BV1]|uniref:hypothetical protein n=1 Tax=Halorubrum sp. BV1 TaxID=1498500 RepID=UPI000B1F05BD|nr:hypothetical protein [Halorubrum sp. BV1]